MSYVPHRLIQSWKCLCCGKCCREFQVPLPPREHERFEAAYPEAVASRGGKPYVAKSRWGCVFQRDDRCVLHGTDLKPFWCRLWPFCVSPHAIEQYEDTRAGATFFHDGRDHFVYLHAECAGVNHGDEAQLREGIVAAIELCTPATATELWVP